MKATKVILYIVIAAIVIYLIYKAYTNYQISGSVFRSSAILSNYDYRNNASPMPEVIDNFQAGFHNH